MMAFHARDMCEESGCSAVWAKMARKRVIVKKSARDTSDPHYAEVRSSKDLLDSICAMYSICLHVYLFLHLCLYLYLYYGYVLNMRLFEVHDFLFHLAVNHEVVPEFDGVGAMTGYSASSPDEASCSLRCHGFFDAFCSALTGFLTCFSHVFLHVFWLFTELFPLCFRGGAVLRRHAFRPLGRALSCS